jgi:hypothetical protein
VEMETAEKPVDDIFQNGGGVPRFTPQSRSSRALDIVFDLRLAMDPRVGRMVRRAPTNQRVLISGVEVPARAGALKRIVDQLVVSSHQVDVSTIVMKPQGKFANVDEAVANAPRLLAEYDWLVIVDDDVRVEDNFLDCYLALAASAELDISQPAHRFASYASFGLTRRRFGSLVRESNFVEIGPLTVLRATTFAELLPFPKSRWCWGIDVLWSDIARRRGWRMGIVDALPIGHLSPVASTYDNQDAVDEGRAMLKAFGVDLTAQDVLRSGPLSSPIMGEGEYRYEGK